MATAPRPNPTILSRLFVGVVGLLPLVGCGGAEEGRPSRDPAAQVAAIDECAEQDRRVAEGWEFQSVVDFEPPADALPGGLLPLAECNPETACGFYFNYDSLLSPTDPPNPLCDVPEGVAAQLSQSTGPAPTQEIPGGRCGSSAFGYHLVATNMAICTNTATGRQGWGANLAVTFDPVPTNSGQSNMPLDASSWDGLSFWVRVGEQPSASAVLATVTDPYTANAPTNYETYCQTADGVADAKKCDPFGLAVLLRPEWRFVKLPFALVQQKGFGLPSPSGELDTSVLVGFGFGLSAGNWDFWLDDVALYREP